jgi:hypothetical protein
MPGVATLSPPGLAEVECCLSDDSRPNSLLRLFRPGCSDKAPLLGSNLLIGNCASKGQVTVPIVILSGVSASRSGAFTQSKDLERRDEPHRRKELSHLSFIPSPANSICAPGFSAKSFQRGFFDSIRAIFFARLHPFSCFSRPIAR